MNALIIGDPHSHPSYDNDRFRLACEVALARGVDTVVCMGDWFDFTSLCKGARLKEREGMRVEDEVAAGHDALSRFMLPLRGIRKKPVLYLCEGNHDARPDEVSGDDPHLSGAIAADRYVPFRKAGWLVAPFKTNLVLDHVVFSHYQASGVMGRPIGGATPEALARSLVAKCHRNVVVGHDHRFGHASQYVAGGSRLHGFTAGCFVHPEYTEGWCKQTEPMWDRGLLQIHTREGRVVDHRWTSMGEL